MANKFVSILDTVGSRLEAFFKSPLAANIETDGIDIAEIAFPQYDLLWTGLKASIAKAQSLASVANPQGATTAQVTALVLGDAQSVFQEYQTVTNTTIETAQQKKIIQGALALLAELPSPVTTSAAQAPVPAQPSPVTTSAAQALVPAQAPVPVVSILEHSPSPSIAGSSPRPVTEELVDRTLNKA